MAMPLLGRAQPTLFGARRKDRGHSNRPFLARLIRSRVVERQKHVHGWSTMLGATWSQSMPKGRTELVSLRKRLPSRLGVARLRALLRWQPLMVLIQRHRGNRDLIALSGAGQADMLRARSLATASPLKKAFSRKKTSTMFRKSLRSTRRYYLPKRGKST